METIEITSEVKKAINKLNCYSNEQFANDAKRYIKAIKERRMVCIIDSVSSSGTSRVLRFLAPEKNTTYKTYNYQNFFSFFISLGFSKAKNGDGFRVSGCGMDMIFHTNHTIIHKLHRMGFITKKQCDILSQDTPVRL